VVILGIGITFLICATPVITEKAHVNGLSVVVRKVRTDSGRYRIFDLYDPDGCFSDFVQRRSRCGFFKNQKADPGVGFSKIKKPIQVWVFRILAADTVLYYLATDTVLYYLATDTVLYYLATDTVLYYLAISYQLSAISKSLKK
jgi:hypothetical protein